MEEVDTGTIWQYIYNEVRKPLLGNCPQEQYYDEEEYYEEEGDEEEDVESQDEKMEHEEDVNSELPEPE